MAVLAAVGPGGCRRTTGPPDPQGMEPSYVQLEREGKLAALETQLWAMLEKCRLCPRRCEVNRLAGESRICMADHRLRVSAAMPHFGEEKPLVGRAGSGTVFFSHCNLRCCFCQNWEIAHRGDGQNISHHALAERMMRLQQLGCHNINLVTPTHFVPHIIRGLRVAIGRGLRLPIVYNTGGYDSLEVIRLLDGIVDIYMPDFKFFHEKRAYEYCREAGDYPEVAASVIREMNRQVGPLRTDERGIATRGLLLRHLVMPNNVSGTDRILHFVANELGRDTYVNLMAQYRPAYRASDHPEIARPLTAAEWSTARRWATEEGLERLAR